VLEDEIEAACLKVIEDYPKQVQLYRSGKTAFGFLVGQVHRATQGRALPCLVDDTMRRLLEAPPLEITKIEGDGDEVVVHAEYTPHYELVRLDIILDKDKEVL
jgi:hypothetical protein